MGQYGSCRRSGPSRGELPEMNPDGDDVVTAASAAATECPVKSSKETNTMSKSISNTATTTSAKAAKPIAAVSEKSALSVYREKRAAKLAEVAKADPLKAATLINFREYHTAKLADLVTLSMPIELPSHVNLLCRDYSGYCNYMGAATAAYWTREAKKPAAPVSTKRVDQKKAQLAKLVAARAKLEAELKALGIDVGAETATQS
jgi:hypothetical protein